MGDIWTDECICGAAIRQVPLNEFDIGSDVWVSALGDFCYPDDPNPVDASARHEPVSR